MGKIQEIDTMFDVLVLAGLTPKREALDDDLFERQIAFSALGVDYWIVWWSNMAYLHVGSKYRAVIPFNSVRPDHLWPAHRNGLVFDVDGGGKAYVATELLDWQKEQDDASPEETLCPD